MNRRNLRSKFATKLPASVAMGVTPSSVAGLEPYEGDWTQAQASHLLRRTMFGVSSGQIKDAIRWGLDRTIRQLLAEPSTLREGPINPGKFDRGDVEEEVRDAFVLPGQPWVKRVNGTWEMAPFPRDAATFVNVQTYRTLSLKAWKTEQILEEGISVWEKMTLFWHNHFAVFGENSGLDFLHITTLFEHALGNFRDLVEKITLDPAMLVFLNGNGSTKLAPNENYARELFELFTIGKGPLVGPGDYTNYTEADIYEAARVLTGWVVKSTALQDTDAGVVRLTPNNLITFDHNSHDIGVKKFSNRFGGKEIANEGNAEYSSLIRLIFSQDECAFFIARKIYRWFVYYKIDEHVEQMVISPMADLIIQNDYEIAPALEALLKSAHFYEFDSFGQMIKNPYDFVMSILKPLGVRIPTGAGDYERFTFYLNITQLFSALQMSYFEPPTVAGWKAYYQEPLFYRTWINASTLNFRSALLQSLMLGPGAAGLDILRIVRDLEHAEDPNQLINDLSQLFLPQAITTEQKKQLKDLLIPGLPDFEWTIEYENHILNPEDDAIRNGIEQKLRKLFHGIMSMSEFYLS